MKLENDKLDTILLAVGFLGITLYAILVTLSLYRTGHYPFHDIGLINDWMTNALKGRPFYITDYGWNHLAKHFTPSLLLLIPFYLTTNSQYILLFLNCLSIGFIFLESFSLIRIYGQKKLNYTPCKKQIILLSFLICLLFSSNSFIKTNVINGHFEIFATPLIVRLVRYFILQKTDLIFYILLVLVLGIRQDVSLFVLFLFTGISWKFSDFKNKKIFEAKTLLSVMLICATWLVISVKVVMPSYSHGIDNNIVLWSSWGSTYPEIVFGFVTHPFKLMSLLFESAALDLFKSFGFLCLLHPVPFLISHIPSILIYTMDRVETRQLYWYNSAFLIPSCLVFSLFSIASLLKWLEQKGKSKMISSFFVLTISLLVIVLPETHSFHGYYIRPVSQYQKTLEKRIHILVNKCDKNARLSSDFWTFVYLPLKSEKVLLRNWKTSDLIIFNPAHAFSVLGFENHQDIKSMIQELENNNFNPIMFDPEILVYYKSERNRCSLGK